MIVARVLDGAPCEVRKTQGKPKDARRLRWGMAILFWLGARIAVLLGMTVILAISLRVLMVFYFLSELLVGRRHKHRNK
jgi:hypothetical protein